MVSWERSEMDAGISQTYTEMCFPKSEFGKEGDFLLFCNGLSLGKRGIGESVMVSWEWSGMDAGISKTYTEMCFPKSEFGKESMELEFSGKGKSLNYLIFPY